MCYSPTVLLKNRTLTMAEPAGDVDLDSVIDRLLEGKHRTHSPPVVAFKSPGN